MAGQRDFAPPAKEGSFSEGRKAERDLERPVPTGEGCLERLMRVGAVIEKPGPTTNSDNATCEIAEAVLLLSVADSHSPGQLITFRERPRLSCLMAERFVRFTTTIIAPLARGTYGKELVAVATGPGYECRPRNRQAGAKLSSHAQGNAVDISSVELSGGRSITVQNPGDATSERFVTGFREAACGFFNTVLGPGSDAAHHDHIHIDIEMRGRDGRSKFCQ